jgi:pyridoxamine 5'-phosphate oxidase
MRACLLYTAQKIKMKSTDIRDIRRQYIKNTLASSDVHKNPLKQFQKWFSLYLRSGSIEPNAMVLSTASPKGRPSARVVLLKGLTDKGFIFYTNYKSKKGSELHKNPFASLLFYWAKLEKQIRVEGKVKKISRVDSEKYFNSRPYASRISAWSSHQSSVIAGREEIDAAFKKYSKMYPDNVPQPDYWGGYILIPYEFEFWQGRANRLHDRLRYKKSSSGWKIERLAP